MRSNPGRRARTTRAHRPRTPPPGRRTTAPTRSATSGPGAASARDVLPVAIVELSRDVGIPNGIGGFGYREADIEGLVAGTLKQQRLLAIAPRQAGPDDLVGIFRESMRNW